MTEIFLKLITETTKENFINSHKYVISHPEYNPYSDDISLIENLLDQNKFEEVTSYFNINILLSPRAHLFKNYALEKLGKDQDANSELIIAQKIIEGICLTGNGSKTAPYIVTRVSDEKDVLNYLQEQYKTQRLVSDKNRFYDVITCQSGKEIYFDITSAYSKMTELIDTNKIKMSFDSPLEKKSKVKKWWEFWK